MPSPCPNDIYEQRMAAALATAREQGVTAVAFGDLYLADVRLYREKNMAGAGMTPLFPLWLGEPPARAEDGVSSGELPDPCAPGAPPPPPPPAAATAASAALARAMLAAGTRAIVTAVDTAALPAAIAGRVWDAAMLEELPEGVDPCGEAGEFHTFVTAGPAFMQGAELSVVVGETVMRGSMAFADVMFGGAS